MVTEKVAMAVVAEKVAMAVVAEMNALPVKCKQERKKASMVEYLGGRDHGRSRTEMVTVGWI